MKASFGVPGLDGALESSRSDFLSVHHPRRHHFGDQGTRGVCVTEELGGSALIHRLLKELQACTHENWDSVLAVNETQALEKMKPAEPFPAKDPRWIVLQISAPVGEKDLWRELSEFHADRLVVVVSATELWRADVRLSHGLSWEQTLEDLHGVSLRRFYHC